jgi:hypothetical protein
MASATLADERPREPKPFHFAAAIFSINFSPCSNQPTCLT